MEKRCWVGKGRGGVEEGRREPHVLPPHPVFTPEMRVNTMKETSRRRITVTSSLNEITTDQLGNRVVARGGGRCLSARPHPFLQQASGQISKDNVNGFFFTSDICFMVLILTKLFHRKRCTLMYEDSLRSEDIYFLINDIPHIRGNLSSLSHLGL
jgi:hypothetical protein